ncbi:CaiB/BaiF CoA transferase family protein [Streptomyces chartreusis]|uniref:CaiB/BaiF CoA transferase family protein n=1 Tax=Streptomyces chartreusis TaxID=1969 RepID=UPI0036327710
MSGPVAGSVESSSAVGSVESSAAAGPDEPAALPLSGIRVLELASVIAAPYAGSLLRLLGAEVVKVEAPAGDPIRKWDSPRGPLPFAQINAGKRSVVIDLKTDEGVALVKGLIADFDVLTHNLRPASMERLGLGATACHEINPRLVYLGVTGFGSTGPWAARPAYDSIGQAFSGLLALLTPPGATPAVGPALGDLGTGVVAAAGVLAALVQRERTGRGSVVETSLLEGTIALIADQFSHLQATGTQFNIATRARTSGIFMSQTADADLVVIHVSTSGKFFEALMAALDRKDLVEDPRFRTFADRSAHHEELQSEILAVTRGLPTEALLDLLVRFDVPHTRVNSLRDLMEHPQIEALGLFDDIDDASGMQFTGAPWRIDGRRPGGVHDWPTQGRDTREVLGALVGEEQLRKLHERGVIDLGPDATP